MRSLDKKIWFTEYDNEFRATVSFTEHMSFIPRTKIPFDQRIEIRENLRTEIYQQIFGHMPQTCKTIIRHLSVVETEVRKSGDSRTANKLSVTKALVDSLLDQMLSPKERANDDEDSPTTIEIKQKRP